MRKIALITCVMLFGVYAKADYTVDDHGEVPSFSAENPANVKPFTVDYSYRTVPFETWDGIEKKVLNLHEGFQPDSKHPLIMYIAKVSFLVDKPATAIDLNRFLNIELVRSLDRTIQQTPISPNDVITYQDKKLAFRNPAPPSRWCDDPHHTLCLKSVFTLPGQYQIAFALYERGRGSKYTDLEGQSEIRIENQIEIKNPADLKQLTGISTEPAGVLEQNVFWFTHAIEYIKVLGVVQPHPTEGNRSIVTGYLVFGIEKKTWNMKVLNFVVRDLILSRGGNTQDGILAGLPKLTQHLSLSLANEFER